MSNAPAIRRRLDALDWSAIETALSDVGYARAKAVLTKSECETVAALYADDARFRKRVVMERHRFGVGDYAYFRNPLPPVVRELRTHAYRRLAPIANRWQRKLGARDAFPSSLRSFAERCHRAGQTRPTPLVLHYSAGGYNNLHQDLYGGVVFPLQITAFLSRPDRDYTGGEFLLVEQHPRSQSRGHAITPERGEIIIFPSAERPVASKRGHYRAKMRHGVSPLASGERYTLGIIFHDGKS